MKKLYTLLALVVTLITNAQAPQGFNYQATVRNSTGDLIVNQNVNFKFNIMLNSATSLPVFSETHMAPTDDLGQVNLVIGQGTATIGTFSTINWGTGNYYLGIELNTGAGYVAMGTTQLLSVPYALYANSAGNAQADTPNLADVLAVNNGANNLQIKNLAEPTDAEDAATKNYVDNATSTNTTLTDGSIFVGNASNVATGVALSGDVTISNTGLASISDNAVSTSNITDANVTDTKLDKANIPLSGFGAATADVDLGTKNIKNLADPIDNQDAVTKQYVDLLQAQINNLQQQLTSNLIAQYPAGSVFCASGPTEIVPVLNPITGRTWMDRNLGASRAATSSTDVEAYGDLYQWGRRTDGHQCRNSATTTVLSSVEQPNHGDFIISNSSPWDWLVPQNYDTGSSNALWYNVKNNPCPSGYRVPNDSELNAERASWSSNNPAGAFASPLKLPMAGFRGGLDGNDGSLNVVGTNGSYWSSTNYDNNSVYNSLGLGFESDNAYIFQSSRLFGDSIRCIKYN